MQLIVTFVVLKALGYLSWDWPVVLTPLWVQLGTFATAFTVGSLKE